MPIRTETKEVRVCDLCGKEEDKHLKSSDFYTEAPILMVKNFSGKTMMFQLNIDIWSENEEDKIELKLGDVLSDYDMRTQPTPTGSMPFVRLIPINMMQQLPILDNNEPEYIVCKACYYTLANMITTYGRFDKVEKF